MKYCSNCGTKYLEDAQFCVECGQKIPIVSDNTIARVEENVFEEQVVDSKIEVKETSEPIEVIDDTKVKELRSHPKDSKPNLSELKAKQTKNNKKIPLIILGIVLLLGSLAFFIWNNASTEPEFWSTTASEDFPFTINVTIDENRYLAEAVTAPYEFMDFYSLSGINYIWFSQEGSFAKLQRLVGKRPDEVWSEDDKLTFSSIFSRFTAEYKANGGDKLPIEPGDAFLSFIKVYDYHTLDDMTSAELKAKLIKSWDEFQLLITDDSLELQMDPSKDTEVKKNIFARLIPVSTPKQHVAFIHEKTAKTSGWTYSHELGRMHLEEAFADQISTTCYNNATEENAEELLNQAIADGNNLIFTTSPPLMKASLKVAIEHPEVKILNCSLNTSHKYIRTYYARMYEAKFLMGAVAGAMSRNGKIGYIADYPIFGMTANINAFALGAKMVNPRAKIFLEWSTLKDHDVMEAFKRNEVHYISGQDMIIPGEASRHFGLYRADEESPLNLAMPIWHWGKFYEKMIRNIMDGSFKYDNATANTKGLNYWWGMSAGIIDVICSKHLPIGTARLVDLLKQTICQGDFNPFSGVLYSQKGLVQRDADKVMSPEEIVTMDWLAENVIGFIPKMDDLIEKAKPVVKLQGIDNPEAN